MTAEELFEKYKVRASLSDYIYLVDREDFGLALIEFAKYHVQKALELASQEAESYIIGGLVSEIDKDSIINAYTLENIK